MRGSGRARSTLRAATLAATLALTMPAPAAAEFEFLNEFGAPKEGELAAPFSIERENVTGTVSYYVVDLPTRRVNKFDANGNLLLQWGTFGSGPGQFSFPTAVGSNQAGGQVYIADISGTDAAPVSRIQRFDTNGNYLGEFGSFGTAEGQLGFVRGITVDSMGRVFVADTSNNRIQRFSATGQFERMWGKDVDAAGGTGFEVCTVNCKQGVAGAAAGELRAPIDLSVVADVVFVSDSGNDRIQRFNAQGNFILQGGSPGSGDGQLDSPAGIDANQVTNRVYVADLGNNRVQAFTVSNLDYVSQFGSKGKSNGQFESALGLAETNSFLAVADPSLSRVQRFNGSGAFQGSFGEPSASTIIGPTGIGAGPGRAYVSDAARDRVMRFSSGGEFLDAFGSEGSAPGELMSPSGIGGPGAGDLFVADRQNDRVQRFAPDGTALGTWGSSGTAAGEFNDPRDVAVGLDGSVYVADTDNNRVQRFNQTGGFLGAWGVPGTGNGQFDDPRGVGTDAVGSVYVADSGNDRIQKFDAEGNFLTAWGSPGSGEGQFQNPLNVAADPSGNLFVADSGNDRVQRFDLAGTFLGFLGGAAGGTAAGEFLSPGGVEVDPDGDVYVLDSGNNRVQRFAGAGAAPVPIAAPKLTLSARRAPQSPGRLKLEADCGGQPCTVSLAGRIVAAIPKAGRAAGLERRPEAQGRLSVKLKPAAAAPPVGEAARVKMRPRKRKLSLPRLKSALRRGARGKAIVNGVATNAAGSVKARLRIKLKRPK